MQGRLTKMKKGHASAAFLLFSWVRFLAGKKGEKNHPLNQLGARRFNPVAGFLECFG